LFRRTNKALTITGYRLDTIRELGNIDRALDWAVVWGERRKARAAEAAVSAAAVNGFNGNGSGYSIDQIEQIVRSGAPAGENRSNLFHGIVGHYVGCGWDVERIFAHLQQFPDGIGARYLREDRLHREIARSASKYDARALPPSDAGGWVNGFETKAPQPDPELDDDVPEQKAPDAELDEEPEPDPDEELDPDDDPELADDEPSKQDPDLQRLYAHGDPDPRPIKSWTIKKLMPECGHGLLSGQWGAGKTFMVFELAAALGSGQPFLGHVVKRQCGALLIAAEGADEIRLRLDAVIRAKCGNMQRAPFRWYENAPTLLHKDAVKTLVAMAKQAEASLQREFGLPLGLVVIDTIAACAGYARSGDENDPAAAQAVMNVLKAVAQQINCFVEFPCRSASGEPLDPITQDILCYWQKAHYGGRYLMFSCSECHRSARVLYAWYHHDRIWFFSCRKCAGITYQSTMGHRWDRSARRVEKLRARLKWGAGGTVPIKPRGMHKRTYQHILGMLAYHEVVRKRGASYARKYRPEQHRAHLWRQCRNRFADLGGWPVR
jgi:AAA domain